jgi:hypothetical protein
VSFISGFVWGECEVGVKWVLGGDSMWVLREKAGDGGEILNVNGLVTETESMVGFGGFLFFCLACWSLLIRRVFLKQRIFHSHSL